MQNACINGDFGCEIASLATFSVILGFYENLEVFLTNHGKSRNSLEIGGNPPKSLWNHPKLLGKPLIKCPKSSPKSPCFYTNPLKHDPFFIKHLWKTGLVSVFTVFSRTFRVLTIFWYIFVIKVPIFRKKTGKTGNIYHFIFHIFGKFNLKLSFW